MEGLQPHAVAAIQDQLARSTQQLRGALLQAPARQDARQDGLEVAAAPGPPRCELTHCAASLDRMHNTRTMPPPDCPRSWLGEHHDRNERRTRWVVILTCVMMVAEIVGGSWYGSMAVVA